ncbi:GNAT family N-acetyltransferase [Streptomyces sp. NPDC101490]|uniref:GNAT family N-acetyltransferase n=1 Tax=Streptomyces sp. NPDC101490 TaxID=3366143 RepID=UPI00381A58A8
MELMFYGHSDARDIRSLLLDIHDEAYFDEDAEFHSRERFAEFVDRWSSSETWSCVIGYEETEPAGYAYGAAFSPGGWWRGSETPASVNDDTKVFALSELMVLPKRRRTGASEVLHRALVEHQGVDVVTLFVDTAHPRVKSLYESWGYVQVDESKPYDDSPLYAVMLKDLR